jgi:hypothetical protein
MKGETLVMKAYRKTNGSATLHCKPVALYGIVQLNPLPRQSNSTHMIVE